MSKSLEDITFKGTISILVENNKIPINRLYGEFLQKLYSEGYDTFCSEFYDYQKSGILVSDDRLGFDLCDPNKLSGTIIHTSDRQGYFLNFKYDQVPEGFLFNCILSERKRIVEYLVEEFYHFHDVMYGKPLVDRRGVELFEDRGKILDKNGNPIAIH